VKGGSLRRVLLNMSLRLGSSGILNGVELGLGLERSVHIWEVHKLSLELGKLGLYVGQGVLICNSFLSNAVLLDLTSCDGWNLGGMMVETVGFLVVG
jgi:hypothetical protein